MVGALDKTPSWVLVITGRFAVSRADRGLSQIPGTEALGLVVFASMQLFRILNLVVSPPNAGLSPELCCPSALCPICELTMAYQEHDGPRTRSNY